MKNVVRKMDTNSLKTVEIISTNFDILYHIFKYLNFNEQLKLTRVSKLFRDIIINYIWKTKYKELKVIKTSKNYIVTNIKSEEPTEVELVQECRLVLSDNDFEEFFEKNSENIQKLCVCTETQLNGKENKFKLTQKLQNLSELKFSNIQIQNADLEELKEICPILKKLCLDNCCNRNNTLLIVVKDINIAALEKIPKLKCLEIYSPLNSAVYLLIEKVFEKLQLEQFKFNGLIQQYDIGGQVKESESDKSSSSAETYPCEELSLGGISQNDLDKFSSKFLSNLNNLKKLTIDGFVCTDLVLITDKFFKQLSAKCANLKYLKLQNCRIQNFKPILTLNELILENCSDLTWHDLKSILGDMKLKSFTSLASEYSDEFQYFKVSKTLEYLNYEGSDDEKFTQLWSMDERNFKSLTSLKWSPQLKYGMAENLTKYCPNLENLCINSDNFEFKDLYELKSLRKLEIISSDAIKQDDLLTLLKHKSLRNLKIDCYIDELDSDEEDNQLLMDATNDNTNLLLLDMDINTFMKFEDYWLGLLEKNHHLNLLVSFENFITWKYFLQELKNNPLFPKRSKFIKINGFNIDCHELMENFNETFHWMKSVTNNFNCSEIVIIF